MWLFIFLGKLRTLRERVPPEADYTDEFSVHDSSNCFTGNLLEGKKEEEEEKMEASLSIWFALRAVMLKVEAAI